MYQPDLCIHHHPCADGFTAAWAVWKRYGDSVRFHPGVHGEAPPAVTGLHVLIVDFSYKRPVLEAMSQTAASITILDHHKSAQADLETFAILNPMSADDIEAVLAATQPGLGNIRAEFDMNRSGARMAWNFCHPDDEPRAVPHLVRFVEDRDLWRFELEGSREVAAAIFSREYDFEEWDALAMALDDPAAREAIIAEGSAIERKHHKDVAELVDQTMRYMVIGGFKVPVANLPYTMASDAANRLAEGNPFAACYFDRADGKRVFSLRSLPEGQDVSLIAASYGGGGHRNAAGFQAPQGWEGEVELSPILAHSRRELALLRGDEPDEMQDMIEQHILKMVQLFADEGHSGSSADYSINILEKLLRWEPITPLTGADDEWNDCSHGGEPSWQNNRCSRVFKGADGRAYDIQGRVFIEPGGAAFTSRDSRVYVEFPYRPATEYVEVAPPEPA